MKLTKILILALFISSMYSCKIKKPITDILIFDTEKEIKINEEQTVEIIKDTTSAIDNIPSDTTEVTPNIIHKNIYNIAVILPFYADSVNTNWELYGISDFEIPKIANKSISFIQGMMLALNGNAPNAKFNLKVYDNYASYFKTSFILNKLKFEELDYIIGPINKKNIQLVSQFAKEKEIPMISPFSPSIVASNAYKNYIMPESSIDIHFNEILSYINNSMEKPNLKILYPNSSKGIKYYHKLQNNINDIVASNSKIKKELKYAFIEIESNTNDRKNFEIEDYLDENTNNIVFVPSTNEGFVHNMLTKLNEKKEDYNIVAFGMPNWGNFKTLRLDYFNNLNAHYSSTKWVDKSNPDVEAFNFLFKQLYSAQADEDAYSGFDIMNFMVKSINKFGVQTLDNIGKIHHQGILRDYHFKPTTETISVGNSQISRQLRIENNALHIISYEDFHLILKK